ncbi:DivIVA domain-containing protein [Macrococcus equipercicus]|uniref:DivIVA domain-containing protein n=1 Tax=Macrococcus equipercicus TaxID=69967 RepID=A0A9Q9BRY8_9STAP|nr:DivIVA domain-containing protein [Macrococcus equipercicus]KAA1042718.1 DivIVA domain-containing protein [Macrococcus equipercicus]UTH14584.1 DivIVA domain-containing protein [Macrococcus equipercicus]
MNYSPSDIEMKQFNIVHKGLNENEVRDYLRELSDELERQREEKAMLQRMIDDKDENISRFRAVENTIGEALVVAQRAGDEIKAAAGMQADVIIKDAQNHADQIVNDAMQKAREISFQTEDMKRQSKIFRARFRMLVEAQLDLLKNEDWDYLLNYDLETKPIEQSQLNDVESE